MIKTLYAVGPQADPTLFSLRSVGALLRRFGGSRCIKLEEWKRRWSGNLYLKQAAADKIGIGSAVAVGPSVFLTAKHVLLGKANVGQRFALEIYNRVFEVEALGHDDYDIAVCEVLDGRPFDGAAETIDTTASALRGGAEILLSGWGESGLKWSCGGSFCLDRVAVVDLRFKHGWLLKGRRTLYACDSGGAVFSVTAGSRRVIGVGAEQAPAQQERTSLVVPLSRQPVSEWLQKWVSTKPASRRITGITSGETVLPAA